MKHLIHYVAETCLVSSKGIVYGETGGLTYEQKFSELGDAIYHVNKYKSFVGQENVYNPLEFKIPYQDIRYVPNDESKAELYHLIAPKIWKMIFRGDWRLIKEVQLENWVHNEGDTYVIKYEYFNLKTKLMEHSSYTTSDLKEAIKNLKIKDSKTRIASDFTFYSRSLLTSF